MSAQAFRFALALMLVVAALLVVPLWSARGQEARAERQRHSDISEGQTSSANGYWTDPMRQARTMGSFCPGPQRLFWNTAVNR